MLYTKSQGHRLLVLERKILNVFFFISYGHGDHLAHVTKIICINFSYLIIRRLHMKLKLSSIGLTISEKPCFNILMELQYERP